MGLYDMQAGRVVGSTDTVSLYTYFTLYYTHNRLNKNREASPSAGEENSANIAGNAVNLSDPTISSSYSIVNTE